MSTTLSEALRALAHEWSPDVAYLLERAADELEHPGSTEEIPIRLDLMPMHTPAACIHDWGMKILTTNPPKRRCERCGFTEVVPGAEFVKGHEVHDATLDAEAEALMQEWAGDEANLDWQNIAAHGRIDWRRVAQKAREMHRKTASMKECAYVYMNSVGTQSERLRAVLQHLGVEVTP